jgi:uncharacterized protein YjiS (DUF1127 family)
MTLQTIPGSAGARQPHGCGADRHVTLSTALRRISGLLRRWRERQRLHRQLRSFSELDDHILQDIGLTRSTLLREATKPFWR